MSKATTAACAFALALAWAVAPASAQTTPPTPEQKADQIEKKADRQADQVRGKARDGSDTAGGKLERAWDKTKAKAREARDKVTGGDDGRRADADVRSAQMALRDRGYDPGAIDGVMGPRTSAAVRDFQQKENLAVTGQLDAETRAKLDAAPSASPATSEKAGNQQSQRQ